MPKTTGLASLKRNTPGVVTASESLTYIKDRWLKGTHGNVGKVPAQVAEKMKGREFANFDAFRKAFWKEVANDPVLAKGFGEKDLKAMLKGNAPSAPIEQWNGKQDLYMIHHMTPIQRGGAVYHMDNLLIVTPRYHLDVLDKKYHYGK